MLNDQHNYIISSANCNNISLDNLYKNDYNTPNNKIHYYNNNSEFYLYFEKFQCSY